MEQERPYDYGYESAHLSRCLTRTLLLLHAPAELHNCQLLACSLHVDDTKAKEKSMPNRHHDGSLCL